MRLSEGKKVKRRQDLHVRPDYTGCIRKPVQRRRQPANEAVPRLRPDVPARFANHNPRHGFALFACPESRRPAFGIGGSEHWIGRPEDRLLASYCTIKT